MKDYNGKYYLICPFKNECEKEYGELKENGDNFTAICGTHFCKDSWKPFYDNLKEKNNE